MPARKLRTAWIMLLSSLYTLFTCSLAVVHAMLGSLDRKRANRYLREWCTRLLRAARVTVKVVNPHKVSFTDNHCYILMPNHSSLYDIPICYAHLQGTIRMVVKKELFKIPIFGRAMRVSEHIVLDRKNRKQSIKALQTIKEKMQSGVVIWIAPEGTRSTTGELGEFKKGGFLAAIQTEAKIIPLGIRGAKNILPTKTWQFHLNQKIELHIGKPIDASQYTRKEINKLMTKVSTTIHTLANL